MTSLTAQSHRHFFDSGSARVLVFGETNANQDNYTTILLDQLKAIQSRSVLPTLVRDRTHLIEEIQATAYDLIFIVLSDHNIGLIDLISDMDGISPPVVAILEVEDEQFALDLMQKDIDYLVKSSITPARLSRSLAYHINHRKAHDASRWLHAVVDSSADAIVGKNIHNIIISWNKGAEKIFGYTAAEVIGNPVTILMPDDRKQDADFILAEILAGRNVAQYTTVRKHKSGRLIDVSISAAPVLDNQGNITGVSITTRDVTTRNVRQRVLLDQAEKLRAAFELAHLGSWEWVIEEDRVIWDEGMVDLFGGKRLDTPPCNLKDFINLLHPDDRGDFAQFLASLAIGGAADSIDCRIIWPDGSVHSITTKSQSKVQNKTNGDQRAKIIGVCRDTTQTRQIEENRKQLAIMQEREDFMATLTHDLKNPLIGATRVLELLSSNDFPLSDDERAMLIEQLRDSNKLLLVMIQNLTDAYKLEKDFSSLKAEAVDLTYEIQTCAQEIAPLAMAHDIHIIYELEPSVQLIGDTFGLHRVLQNLMSNALKYTPDGGKIWLRCQRTTTAIIFEIQDTGSGVAVQDIPDLFTRFGRGQHEQKFHPGTGLGLFLCRKIIDAHKGNIQYIHREGHGAIFRFEIPSRSGAKAA